MDMFIYLGGDYDIGMCGCALRGVPGSGNNGVPLRGAIKGHVFVTEEAFILLERCFQS